MKHLRGCPLFTHPTQRPADHPTDCRCADLRREPDPKTQNGRVLRFIREHPGATVMECSRAMDPWISNIRARHSDLRDLGFDIQPEPRSDGQVGFRVVEPGQATLGLTA